MNTLPRINKIFLMLAPLALAFASCVSGQRVDRHADVVNKLVDTINRDVGASEATRDAVQAVADDAQDMAAGPKAQVKAAQSGDWTSLALAGLTALTGVASGVATYKKVNKDRDATSAERTKQDLASLQVVASVQPLKGSPQ